MKLFSESSQRLLAVNYFRKKSSIADFRLGSKYAYEGTNFDLQAMNVYKTVFALWNGLTSTL